MVVDAARVAARQPAADVGAEVVAGPGAVDVVRVGRVLAEERLAQALTGPVGEGGDGVGAHPEQGGDVGRLLLLDLGVPQHHLPALRQRGEGLRGGGVLEALDGGVVERQARVERREVVDRPQP